MKFTYEGYEGLLNLLKENNYTFCNYFNCDEQAKPVIFRHDIDHSLDKAIEIAKIEHKNGVRSTFFVLIVTDFYNALSKRSYEILKEIDGMGHEIGLHFNERRYAINDVKDLEENIRAEMTILGKVLNKPVKTVSMHIPSKWILENDIKFDGIVNSYSKKYLQDFKYLSDSQMHWREDVLSIIQENRYGKLHILTHPVWYSKYKETLNEKFLSLANQSKIERYEEFKVNFRNSSEVLSPEEL